MSFYQELGGHYVGRAADNEGVHEELLDACALVAKYTRTKYLGKSHGGYDIFQNEKIEICLDTYVPNIRVDLSIPNADGERQDLCVLFWNYGGFAQVYKPGHWEEYIAKQLLPEALKAKRVADEEIVARAAAERERDFGPVDDAVLFVPSPFEALEQSLL